MAAPPTKRFCEEITDGCSSENSVGPDGIFPSDSEEEHCFFPSEDSNQIIALETSTIEEPLSDTSLDNLEVTQIENSLSDELTKIGNILVSSCCDKFCLRHLTAMDVIACQSEMNFKGKTDQRKYLFSKLMDGSSQTSQGVISTRHFVAGKEICPAAWCKVFCISYRTLRRMEQKIPLAEGVEHGNCGKKRKNTKTEAALAWMDRYFNLVGDKMPDSNQIHLPCWENQKDIHYRYCCDLKARGSMEEDLLGISMFYKVWTDNFSNVVIPEVRWL